MCLGNGEVDDVLRVAWICSYGFGRRGGIVRGLLMCLASGRLEKPSSRAFEMAETQGHPYHYLKELRFRSCGVAAQGLRLG